MFELKFSLSCPSSLLKNVSQVLKLDGEEDP